MRHSTLIVSSALHLFRRDGLNPQSAPASGELIIAEQPYSIQWSANTPGPVKIELHYGDASYVNITESTENDGEYQWTPSAVFAGKNDFFLAICDLKMEGECTYTFNGRFAIDVESSTILLTSSLASTSTSPSTATSDNTASGTSSSSMTSIPTTSTTTPPTISTTSPAVSTSQTSAPKPDSGGLPLGATIGLSVALSVVGTALLIGLGLFFWKRNKRRNTRQRQGMDTTENGVYLYGGSGAGGKVELDGRERAQRAELEGNHAYVPDGEARRVYELPEWRR